MILLRIPHEYNSTKTWNIICFCGSQCNMHWLLLFENNRGLNNVLGIFHGTRRNRSEHIGPRNGRNQLSRNLSAFYWEMIAYNAPFIGNYLAKFEPRFCRTFKLIKGSQMYICLMHIWILSFSTKRNVLFIFSSLRNNFYLIISHNKICIIKTI